MPSPSSLTLRQALASPGSYPARGKWLTPKVRSWLLLATVIMASLAALAAWRHYYPVVAGAGWSVEVRADNVPDVSALAPGAQGGLLISQAPSAGSGAIVERHADGSTTRHITGLAKPTGMLAYAGGIVYGQESGTHPVTWWSGSHERVLFEGTGVEGLASDGRYLYAIEDVPHDGRLLRYDPQRDVLTALRSGLAKGEGLAICPNGQLYYTLKGAGQLLAYTPGGTDRVVLDGLQSPGFLLCNRDGLWISEDTTHMARLLLLAPDERLHTVLSHLRSAQTLLALPDGRYLLAEQGRARILLITPPATAQQ